MECEVDPKPVAHADGLIPRALECLFGASWRTEVASIGAGISMVAGLVSTSCPHLLSLQLDKHELGMLFWSLLGAGSVWRLGKESKDKKSI